MWFSFLAAAFSLVLSIVSLTINCYTVQPDQRQSKYTEVEEKLLAKIRVLAKEELTHDYERTNEFLIRWIQECKLNLNCAYEMIRTAKQWRKDNKMDSILNETLTEVRAFPDKSCSLDTYNKEGFPVLICETEGVDVRKFHLTGQKDNLTRYYLQWIERALFATREVNQNSGKFPRRGIFIINGHGYNIKQHGCFSCINHAQEYVRISGLYYPRIFEYVIFINIPNVGLPLVGVLKPVFSEYYKKSLKIFGTDQEEWSKFLLSIIPGDQLGIRFGGTNPK